MSDPITASLITTLPDLSKVDPDGGLLCLSAHWRANPADPDPDMPGPKSSQCSLIFLYNPTIPACVAVARLTALVASPNVNGTSYVRTLIWRATARLPHNLRHFIL